MKTAMFAWCAWLVCSAVTAAAPEQVATVKTWCRDNDDPSIARVASQLDEADRVLPNIPPEEERYLKAERAAAKRLMLDKATLPIALQKGSALRARPLYAVYELRLELEKARTAIKAILARDGRFDYPQNAEAEKLSRAANSVPDLASYAHEVWEFKNDGALVDERQLSNLSIDARLMQLELASYIKCKLAKAMIQR